MKNELIGGLEVAKASAEKYPNSYILVTGGVGKNGWTEGRRMSDWLIQNGIDKNRIIVEEKEPDTTGNAANSFQMLYEDYKDIKTNMLGIKISGKKEYVQGEKLDIIVKSIDDKNYNVDLTKYAIITEFDTNHIGKQTISITYTQNNKTYKETFEVNIKSTPNNDKEMAINEPEKMYIQKYKEIDYTKKY